MPCGPIQGEDQGHMALKVINSSIFKISLVRHFQWELANVKAAAIHNGYLRTFKTGTVNQSINYR